MGGERQEQGARGRRWAVGLGGMVVGVLLLVAGVVADALAPMIVGGLVFCTFGYIAAGARRFQAEASTDGLSVEAEFERSSPAEQRAKVSRNVRRKD